MKGETNSPSSPARPAEGRSLRRRGLLAAVAGLAAGTLAKVSTTPALAGTDGDVVLGQVNGPVGSTTQVIGSGGAYGFVGQATGTGVGVQGSSVSNAGVLGESDSGWGGLFTTGNHGVASTQTAVQGTNLSSAANAGRGMAGTSITNAGAFGQSTTYYGVDGVSTQQAGVHGRSNAGANVPGVVGENFNSGGWGVYGNAPSGTAVYGQSSSGYGVFAFSNTGAAFQAQSNTNVGIVAASSSTSLPACQVVNFNGALAPGLTVNGTFSATGTKSALVPVEGQYRKLYAVESPDNWFEDFGEARLVNGRASVPIERIFAQTVDTTKTYHVFLTPHSADVEALAVTVRAPDHFEVQANGKGTVDGTFSYRITAMRKDMSSPSFRLAVDPTPLRVSDLRDAGPGLYQPPPEAAPLPKLPQQR